MYQLTKTLNKQWKIMKKTKEKLDNVVFALNSLSIDKERKVDLNFSFEAVKDLDNKIQNLEREEKELRAKYEKHCELFDICLDTIFESNENVYICKKEIDSESEFATLHNTIAMNKKFCWECKNKEEFFNTLFFFDKCIKHGR